MTARVRPSAPRVVAGVLLSLSLSLLGGTVWLGSLVVRQTSVLQDNVAYTQEAVDANVRTLGQAQRELLRLDLALAAVPVDPAAVDLSRAFVDQRTQEGALAYQGASLGSAELLERSRELQRTWTRRVRPLVAAAVADPTAVAEARAQITTLELGYNRLVSDAEISRRVRAGHANDDTRSLITGARVLLLGLAVTVSCFLMFMGVAGLTSWRSRRQRDAATARLTRMNTELRTHALVVHTTDNLVLITDAHGAIEWVNHAFERTTGHALRDVAGRRPGEVLQGPDTDPEVVAAMHAALRAGRAFTGEILNYTRLGAPYWVHLEIHPVRDDAGRLTHFIAIEADVTERRRLEDNLRRASETAMVVAEEKAAFLATMSHEIRTPLNAVLGVTALLEDTDLDDEQREYVDTAARSGSLLLALVNDILDYSALDAGHVELQSQSLHPRTVVSEVVDLFTPTARAAGLQLRHSAASDVPDLVCGDPHRIRQVLVNLVGNAIKFTATGAVSVHTDVGDDEGRPVLRFTVTDTGIGIPPDRLDRIFLPFTQVDPSTTRTHGGSGLGLSICRAVAHHLRGRLEVDSTPGAGSVFRFVVPVAPVVATAAEAAPAAVTPAQPRDLASLRVLLVEDDAVNRMVAFRLLSRLGPCVEVAEDGERAVEAARRRRFDVIFMDVHMPGMDGLAATAGIRALAGPRPTIVALTANALQGDRDRLLAAGMDDYLSKPVTLDALGALLGSVVDGSSAVPLVPAPAEVATSGAGRERARC